MKGDSLRRVFEAALGRRVQETRPLIGGRNSRVFEVRCVDGAVYAAKFYLRGVQDHRDRLGAEYAGLSFLWRNGIRSIPQPICSGRGRNPAIYEKVEGKPIDPASIRASDIDTAVDFLARLKSLTHRPGSHSLPAASEATFSFADLASNLRYRFVRLKGIRASTPEHQALHRFLKEELHPAMERTLAIASGRLRRIGRTARTPLPWSARTLSPSDFGFHNALRRSDGSLVFLDFEYFGWDDPAKTISDFLYHPAMPLPDPLKRRFVSRMLAVFGGGGRLVKRLEIVYPLYGLKWCFILLNEFLPGYVALRRRATGRKVSASALRTRQLSMARGMLGRVLREHEQFPYSI